MSPFVNYRKRSVNLPPGCKDLIDVLQPGRTTSRQLNTPEQPVVTHGRHVTDSLSEIHHYVALVVGATSDFFTLMISTVDEGLTLLVYRQAGARLRVLMLISDGLEQEQRIREFFRCSRLTPLQEYSFAGFSPGEAARSVVYPLPSPAPEASRLTMELLRTACGLTDQSLLRFRTYGGPAAA